MRTLSLLFSAALLSFQISASALAADEDQDSDGTVRMQEPATTTDSDAKTDDSTPETPAADVTTEEEK